MSLKSVVLVAVALSLGSGHHHHGPHHHGPHHHGPHNHGPHPHGPWGNLESIHAELFSAVAAGVGAADERVAGACRRHGNQGSRELVEPDRYAVWAPLPGYSEGDVRVQVSGRALYISAHNQLRGHYTEVRTLPTFVDVTQSVFTYDGDRLDVIFPVKNDANICDLSFPMSTMTVPKYVPNNMSLMPRFGGNTTIPTSP